jgi:hypothetical protein
MGDWVACRAHMDVLEKTKISFPFRESNPDSLDVQLIARSL